MDDLAHARPGLLSGEMPTINPRFCPRLGLHERVAKWDIELRNNRSRAWKSMSRSGACCLKVPEQDLGHPGVYFDDISEPL